MRYSLLAVLFLVFTLSACSNSVFSPVYFNEWTDDVTGETYQFLSLNGTNGASFSILCSVSGPYDIYDIPGWWITLDFNEYKAWSYGDKETYFKFDDTTGFLSFNGAYGVYSDLDSYIAFAGRSASEILSGIESSDTMRISVYSTVYEFRVSNLHSYLNRLNCF